MKKEDFIYIFPPFIFEYLNYNSVIKNRSDLTVKEYANDLYTFFRFLKQIRGLIPADISSAAKDISKFLMVSALAAIGLGTSFSDFRKSGAKPMLHGFIISALVVVVALGVEWCMGIV